VKKQFTLTSVLPVKNNYLNLIYADNSEFNVDINPIIKCSPVFSPLSDPSIFNSVRLGEFGGSVIFGDDENLEMASDNLRARAIEQQGGYSHEYIFEWMYRHSLTQREASIALGLSRRMLSYYLSGAKPIPRTVALACDGWEYQKYKSEAQKLAA